MQRSPFDKVLAEHCNTLIASSKGRDLVVKLELIVEGNCPITHENTVLRVADELLSNSIEHGFYNRQRGHVLVHVVSCETVGIQISVSDDGWGFPSGPIIDGNGFHLLRLIGDLRLGAAAGPFVDNTTVTVVVPFQRCGLCRRPHATAPPGPSKPSR